MKRVTLKKQRSKTPVRSRENQQLRPEEPSELPIVFQAELYNEVSSEEIKSSVTSDGPRNTDVEYLYLPDINGRSNDSQLRKVHKMFDEDINNDAYPDTISKFWIDLHKMKEIGKFNENFKNNVDFLHRKGFAGWKKSRGDGNCYYRAVMSSFLDAIFK